jgi:pimeloyl-ACP methyl ester carboxylesterase
VPNDGRLVRFEHDRLRLFSEHDFDAETQWLTDANGRRTAAIVGGAGERPVLLLHGGVSQAGEWALIAGKLRRRLVIPDWPGCGLSDAVGVHRVGLRSFGEQWLTAVVDALGVDDVDIVGSSTGGYLGFVFALAHPQRVRRLVQVGAPPGLSRTVPLMFRLFATPGLGTLLLRRQPKDAEANRTQVFSNLVARPDRIPVDMLEQDLAAIALPGFVESAVDFSRALVHPLTGLRQQVMIDHELASLTVPTLCVWGTDDNFVKPATVRHVLDSAPSIQLHTVAGAGHLLTFEAPDAVATAITEFLASDS